MVGWAQCHYLLHWLPGDKNVQIVDFCLEGETQSAHDQSLEIPSLDGVLCTERTAKHKMFDEEGGEAVFWKDVVKCKDHLIAQQ